ncbi:MAG: glycosyltransferase family 2 protein [Actinobacteria bacterium]|nr:glycosyltransferase family 2 protein [Actinomycetota bacterium]
MVRLALCLIGHDRPHELREAIASADGRGFDEIVVLDMASTPPLEPSKGVRWMRSEVNLGVAAGRNRLAEATSAECLVFLDDDAVILTDLAERLRDRFEAEPDLAVVAFRVQRTEGALASLEYPFRGRSPRDDAAVRPCTYFVGCGYAARSRALAEVGGYDEGLFYSTEEVDLGYRLMQEGWRLLYDPKIVVEHRPSSRGRAVAPRVSALRLRNRLLIVRRYLPAPIAVVHAAIWGIRTFGEARTAGGLRAWGGAWTEGLRQPVLRRPLPWRKLFEIHRLGGRVLW